MNTHPIVVFLRARYDEDAAAAQRAEDESPAPWTFNGGCEFPAVAEHAARHHPARVLAEVAAKRAIISIVLTTAAVDPTIYSSAPYRDLTCMDSRFYANGIDVTDEYQAWLAQQPRMILETGMNILRHLSAPYADHPDYREEWTP